jgi:hypothetical protein
MTDLYPLRLSVSASLLEIIIHKISCEGPLDRECTLFKGSVGAWTALSFK